MSVKINKPAVIKINKSAQTVVISDVEGPHVELRFNPNSFPVTDPKIIEEWNQYFDITSPATPFNRVKVEGSTVKLYGGSNITIKTGTITQTQLTHVIDNYGCITLVDEIAFANDSTVQTIILSGVTDIETAAFFNCESLTYVSLPSLITAGENCFQNCQNLASVSLPSLTSAGLFFFLNCTSLTSISLPSLVIAESYYFSGCTSLTSVSLPSLTTARDYCFANCSALTSIYIPSCTTLGVTLGDDFVFNGISGQTISLTVPASLLMVNGGYPDGDIAYLQSNNTVNLTISTAPNISTSISATNFIVYDIGNPSSYVFVDWGDGTLEHLGITTLIFRAYAGVGNYNIKIYFYDSSVIDYLNLNPSAYPNTEAFILNNLPNLTSLYCDYNPALISADFGNVTSLITVSLFDTQVSSVNLANSVNLNSLTIYSNNLTNLNISNCSSLTTLYVDSAVLTSLDISSNTSLVNLTVYCSSINALNITNNTSLTAIYISCPITSLDVSNNISLTTLYITCPITSLDVSNNILLQNIVVSNSQISSFDISNNTELYRVYMQAYLSTSDVNSILYYLDVFNNNPPSPAWQYETNLIQIISAPPSIGPPDGITAKANLIAKGWVVNTN